MKLKGITRRKQFCQIKSQIRGSDEYLVVGIDVAKDKQPAFMGSATGKSAPKTRGRSTKLSRS